MKRMWQFLAFCKSTTVSTSSFRPFTVFSRVMLSNASPKGSRPKTQIRSGAD